MIVYFIDKEVKVIWRNYFVSLFLRFYSEKTSSIPLEKYRFCHKDKL